MTFRVELTSRAVRYLEQLYIHIRAVNSSQARQWFNRLEAAISGVSEHPARHPPIPEDADPRQIIFGRTPHMYRVIHAIDAAGKTVTALHIRHGAQDVLIRRQT